MTDRLTILQHNVRHWTIRRYELTNTYNNLDPDIILINDHSLINDERLKIFNYNVHSSNKTNTRHHGTAIAIRKNIDYRLHDEFETDLIAITIETRQGPITIGTDYIPPNSPYLHYIDYLTLLKRRDPVYIIGDLNARHPTLGHNNSNPVGRNVNSLLNDDRCRHIGPHFPTLMTHNSTTSPDIALTNSQTFHNVRLQPGPMTSSDHIPIIATISCNPIAIPIKPRRQFRKADWDGYVNYLTDLNLPTDENPTLEQIDYYLEDWTKHVQDATDKFIPIIKYRTIPGIKPNDTTKLLQIQYDAAIRHIYENGPALETIRLINDLKRRLRDEYKTLQRNTWDQLITNLDIDENPTSFWKTIRRLNGNFKQKIPYIRDSHNNKLFTPQDKERLFRTHWTKIFSSDDPEDNDFDYDHINSIEQTVTDNFDQIKTFDYGDLTRLDGDCPPITINEMTQTLRRFKQKAPGPTKITTIQLTKLPPNMTKHLLYIFNNALSAGYFPDTLKHAHMIFIPKGNTSQYNIKNYRPISLLDIQGKLFDKILNTRLTHHLDRHNIHNDRQHGFRKNRGTHTALATFYETLTNIKQHQYTADIILRDVSKAFDKVWHTGLKHKLQQLGLHTCFTRTLVDYITDRTASIQIDNYTGPHFPLDSGVPQGACLSPTLYNFYTHDIPPPLPSTEYIAFADDITQITSGPYNYRYAAHNTKHAIEQINTFENKWKITTNKTKFTIVPLTRFNTEDIIIGDDHYPYANKGKILGLNFTRTGIHNQVNIRKAIANTNLNKLYRFRHLSTKNKHKLYTTIIRPTLIYPAVPVHTVANTNILSLQRTQNKAVRFITNTRLADRISSKSLHEQLNLPPLNTLLHEHAARTWHKIQHNLPQLYNTLVREQHPTRRHHRFKSSREIAEGPPPPPIYS